MTKLKSIPITETFGEQGEWQFPLKFLREINKAITDNNGNEYMIYEEQIEDVILALGELCYLTIDKKPISD